MNALTYDWAARLLNVTIQGGIALAIALAIASWVPHLPSLAKVWTLRIALLKLLSCALFLGGFAVGRLPRQVVAAQYSVNLFGSITDILLPFVIILWLASVVMGIYRYVQNRRRLTELVHEASPISDAVIIQTYMDICAALNVQKAPKLLAHPTLTSPALVKNGTTSILLPMNLLSDRDSTRTSVALAHELAHHKHQDLVWGWLLTLSDILFFFHPLMKTAIRRLRLSEEYAADGLAMRTTNNHPTAYSRTLLSFADSSTAISGMYAMSDGALELDKRIKEIYRCARPPKRFKTGLAFLALVVGFFSLTPWIIASPKPQTKTLPTRTYAAPVERV